MHTFMGARYGPITKVLNDKVPYVVPDLKTDDVPQADDPGMEGLSSVNLNVVRVSVKTAHAKKKRDELP